MTVSPPGCQPRLSSVRLAGLALHLAWSSCKKNWGASTRNSGGLPLLVDPDPSMPFVASGSLSPISIPPFQGLYDMHIQLQSVPFLHWEAPVTSHSFTAT